MSNSIRDTFFEECEDLLQALAEGLEQMSPVAVETENVNAVFRAVHSMKGGGGAFGLDDLVSFAHTFETVLDHLRSDKLAMSESILDVLLKSGDRLSDLVAAARDDSSIDMDDIAAVAEELNSFLSETLSADTDFEFSFDAIALDLETPEPIKLGTPIEGPDSENSLFEIYFRPFNALFANGHEPALLFEALAGLGHLEVQLIDDALPKFGELSNADFGLAWLLRLTTNESENELDTVFEFVEGLCDLTITKTAPTQQIDLPNLDVASEQAPSPIPSEAPMPLAASEPKPESTLPKVKSTDTLKPAQSGPKPTLRVDLERVDKLINNVGELIINQAMIAQQIDKLELPNGSFLANELESYKLLAREIQEGVMAIRAQPVKPLFQRMGRIVREASQATSKKAKLVTIGDDTEVDKTVVERLADPLTHMVRNAVDHGLESSDERIANGKDPIGSITLSASHRSGSVVIEVSDDGSGLNRQKIKKIATEKGLVAEGADLTDQEIDNLLFLPGFSTVSKVSNLSGRGVGMDVVKNAVLALGGRISISSTPHKGTVFTVILPLTLAVLDGMVVSVADQTMVVPITSILETIRPSDNDVHQLGKDNHVISVRGTYVPIIDVANSLRLKQQVANHVPEVLLVVETEGHGPRALAVNGILDQRQVVIKSLAGNYGKIPGVSAATILGDGKIALILDPENIANMALDCKNTNRSETQHVA